MKNEQKWWREAIVYEIFPRSFQDSNGDGIGDLKGIAARLEVLQALGINTLWLCPIFASPMVDNGYDVSDYYAVHPDFGTLEDLRTLIEEARKRGIRILLDLVLNHTSDQHAWFQEALHNPESPYRNFYIFREGKENGPPNNWRSNFGGSAWEKAPDGTYYLHVFAREQPDLNWENPDMRRELYRMIRWWIAQGIAGFRVDAICFIKKDASFRDLPPDGPDGLAANAGCTLAQPGIQALLAELRDEAFAPTGAFTVAEANGVPQEDLPAYIGEDGFFTTIFDFSYTDMDIREGRWYDLTGFTRKDFREAVFQSQQDICRVGYGAPYLENHDQHRSSSKYLAQEERTEQAKKALALLFFFLQGIPFLYQGQEIGMENYPWRDLSAFEDVSTQVQYQFALDGGLTPEEAFQAVAHRARDNARTPMLWTDALHADFTTGTPWLPVHPEYPWRNVEAQRSQEDSLWTFVRDMIAQRKQSAALFYQGDFLPLDDGAPDDLIAYERVLGQERARVYCNLSKDPATIHSEAFLVALGNARKPGEQVQGDWVLAPFEAALLRG